MVSRPDDMRHVVAWLRYVRWVTCAELWVVVALVLLFPHLDFPLRVIAPLGLASAICRIVATVLAGRRLGVPRPLQAELAEHHRLNDFPTHLFTMWMAGAAIAELVAYYVERVRLALAQRQQLLDEARDRALRSEHLASLTTLAVGAAHEWSTPLATIVVAAREPERNADRLSAQLLAFDLQVVDDASYAGRLARQRDCASRLGP